MMGFDLLEKRSNELYRKSYPKLLLAFVSLGILAVVLTLVLIVLTMRQPKPKNYAALSTGQIVPLFAYSEPVLTDSYIQSWATTAARSVLNLSFDTYESQLEKSSIYFQPEAFSLFKEALLKDGYLKTLIDSKLIMSSFVNGPVVIVWQGKVAGRFVWRVQLPMTISYEGANNSVKKNLIARLVIERVPTADNPRAILIQSINL